MKSGLEWDEIEKADQESVNNFIKILGLLNHPSPVVLLGRKYGLAKRKDGGFQLIFSNTVTDTKTNVSEERWFGTDMRISQISSLCNSVSDEDLIEMMANKTLNEIKNKI